MKAKKFIIVLTLLIMSTVYISGCKISSISHEDIIANDFAITTIDSVSSVMASDLYMKLAKSDLVLDGGILDSTTYFDSLNAIILDSLISLEAKNVNLRKDWPLYRTYKFRYDDFYVKYLYQHLILDSIEVDSMTVDSFIKAHPEAYAYEEQVHARHLVVSAVGLRRSTDSLLYIDYSDDQLDSIAKAKVYDLRAQIDSGADFGYLAFEHSVHRESGKRDGELGYFTRNKYNKEFENVAFSLPIGTISQPFKTPDGWHIVDVIDHVDSGTAPMTPELYSTARSHYANYLANKKSAVFMDSLIYSAEFEFNDSALSGKIHEVPDTTWAAIINKKDTITFFRMPDYLHQHKGKVGLDTLTLNDIKASLTIRARRIIIMQAGDEFGFGDRPEVATERENLYHKYAIDVFLKGRKDVGYEPQDSLVEDYYHQHLDEYVFEKPIYIQHIIAEDSLFAEFLRDQALSGVDFLDLAEQYYPGAEEIRVAASDLGFIGPGEMPENFYRTALGTGLKNISRPVKTEWGYHIIKVLDKRSSRELEQVRPNIVETLKKKHQEEFRREWEKSLFKRHQIDYNLEPIKKIKLAAKNRR